MGNEIDPRLRPKSLADVLEEELDGRLGKNETQELPVLEKQARLRAVYERIRTEQPERSALCLSGGGIRSAIFSLGILQGLARKGLLQTFDYLSTVSGGGYVGGWLTAWIKNHPRGAAGVIEELQARPDFTLNPEPQPIRHLRAYSNYLTPKTGLTSVDSWTLIVTYIRNVFLNWLVLISWLAAAMMIPRLYLAVLNLGPDWSGQATWYLWKLSTQKLQPNWDVFWSSIKQPWDIGLIVLLVAGFVLIAMAMAYAIIDVPSTGNARLSQRRFLLFRQVPLLLASLLLAAWWAISRNVHGSELFQPRQLLPWFIGFAVGSYLTGGLLAIWFGGLKQKERRGRFGPSLSRFIMILVTTVLGGCCLWAFATRMFLDPKKIAFTRDCDATRIPSEQKIKMPAGTEGTIKQIIDASYVIQTAQGPARITERSVEVTERDPQSNLAKRFKSKGDGKAMLIPSGRETKIPAGKEDLVIETAGEGSYVVKTGQGAMRVAKKDVDALKPKDAKFILSRACNASAVSDGQTITLPVGTQGVIRQVDSTGYTVETGDARKARIARDQLDAFDLNPVPAPAKHAVAYVTFGPVLILVVFLLVNFLFTGLSSWVTDDDDREWWGRSGAWIFITIFGLIAINLVVLWGGQAISPTGNQLAVFLGNVQANPAAKAILGAFGGVTGLAGVLLALRSRLGKWLGPKADSHWLLVGVALAFLVLLAVVISWALVLIGSQPWTQHVTAWFLGGMKNEMIDPNSWRVQLFVIFFLTLVILLFGVVMGFFININRFSLHATYRNRLIRAFLGASRTDQERKPHKFTGFDPADNILLRDLKMDKPFHVINAALNLVKGEELAWQERKAESFTMSRLHCGSWHLGYRPSTDYGNGTSLGTALSISGAAASPNMGYHSSLIVGFLMTLFNVRLGWWLGNPGPRGASSWRRKGPRYAVGPLFSEAIGNTTSRYQYINLSDGGHFENLGLYEMVLRRCQFILLVDAGQDFDYVFEDLGNAIRKIRIDLGIEIEIKVVSPRKLKEGDPIPRCAFGTIRYSEVDKAGKDGSFIYIKPVIAGDEPPDVSNYHAAHPEFPHEPTTDQWFSESQLESYRLLGLHAVEMICKRKPTTLKQFFDQVNEDLSQGKPKPA